MNVSVNVFDPRDMQIATHELEAYLADLQDKADQVCERLANIGAERATVGFSEAFYQGTNDVQVMVEPIQNGYRVRASGNAVLFIEFGAGVTYGYGHPEPNGNVPGSYPGKGHWDDPHGWWFPSAGAEGADRYTHTYGNPPSAAMYKAQQECIRNIERVVNEVFNT